jgi:hypothetical protein
MRRTLWPYKKRDLWWFCRAMTCRGQLVLTRAFLLSAIAFAICRISGSTVSGTIVITLWTCSGSCLLSATAFRIEPVGEDGRPSREYRLQDELEANRKARHQRIG